MASKSANEIFSSPEALAAGGPLAVAAGSLYDVGAGAAKEDLGRANDAFNKAKGLQTTAATSGTNTTKGTTGQTSTTSFAPATTAEQQLRDASIANFAKQGNLVDQQEASITGRLGTQTAARDTLGNILSGSAYNLTPDEEARINNLRGADIAASSNAVNDLLTQRLGETSADAARRGIRGQAFTQLQGDAIGQAAKSLNEATLDANRTAASNALALPGQRVSTQAGVAGNFADFSDAARQQAITNRAALQDPVALQQMLHERLAGGTTSTTGTTDNTTSTSGQQTDTGAGAAGILQAGVGLPGEKAGGLSTVLEGVGLGIKGAGAVSGKPPA